MTERPRLFCIYCGARLVEAGTQFCTSCGADPVAPANRTIASANSISCPLAMPAVP